MNILDFVDGFKLEKNLKIFLRVLEACVLMTWQGSGKWPPLNPHLWKIYCKFKSPYEYIFSSLWIDLSFDMLCILSKCSVFTQEDFWRFSLIHPRTRKFPTSNLIIRNQLSHKVIGKSINCTKYKSNHLKLPKNLPRANMPYERHLIFFSFT